MKMITICYREATKVSYCSTTAEGYASASGPLDGLTIAVESRLDIPRRTSSHSFDANGISAVYTCMSKEHIPHSLVPEPTLVAARSLPARWTVTLT